MARQEVAQVGWIYDLLLWTFSIPLDLFFREINTRGSWKVPRRGPVIFVAAPHANQVRNFRYYPTDRALIETHSL